MSDPLMPRRHTVHEAQAARDVVIGVLRVGRERARHGGRVMDLRTEVERLIAEHGARAVREAVAACSPVSKRHVWQEVSTGPHRHVWRCDVCGVVADAPKCARTPGAVPARARVMRDGRWEHVASLPACNTEVA